MQAGLSPSAGGLRVRHCEDMALPAFLVSVVYTTPLASKSWGKNSLFINGVAQAAGVFTSECNQHVPLTEGIIIGRLRVNPLSADSVEDAPPHAQSKFQKIADAKKANELETSMPAKGRDRLAATQRKHASAWVSVLPNRASWLLMPSENSVSRRGAGWG